MAVAPESLPLFDAMCVRERCPFAVVGVATEARELVVGAIDPRRRATPMTPRRVIDMPLDVLLGKPPKMQRDVRRRRASTRRARPHRRRRWRRVAFDVLRHPTVASKRFLITIGDRTVGGLSQPRPDGRPVAGAGRRLRRHARRLLAASPARRWRWASARRSPRSTRRRRAGWRSARRSPTCSPRRSSSIASSSAATGWPRAARPAAPGDDAALYDTVRAVGMELCPALGISVPVGKD